MQTSTLEMVYFKERDRQGGRVENGVERGLTVLKWEKSEPKNHWDKVNDTGERR